MSMASEKYESLEAYDKFLNVLTITYSPCVSKALSSSSVKAVTLPDHDILDKSEYIKLNSINFNLSAAS